MNPRSAGLLFLVALLLAGFVYFYEVLGGEDRREAEEQSLRLFPGIEAADIDAIWLYAGHGVTRVERAGEGWKLIAPVEFPGDEIVLDGIASTFAGLTQESVIEDPQAPGVYGLGADSSVIYFTANGADLGLRLGARTPVGGNQYVVPASQDATERVYMVASWRVTALQKDLDDIRDKRVLDFDRESVDRIRVEWQPEGHVVLQRVGDGWRVRSPVDDEADPSTVDRLLSDLAFMRAEGFQDEEIPDDHSGLETPGLRVELRLGADGSGNDAPTRVLELGAFPVSQFILARTEHQSLYKIRVDRVDDFPRRVAAYRNKDLASFDLDEADVMELRFASDEQEGEAVAVKVEKGEGAWAGGNPAISAERAASLVAELAHLEGSDIVADRLGEDELAGLGFDPPAATLTVFGRRSASGYGVRLAEIEIGVADADRGIIARNPDGKKVYRLDWALAEFLPVSLEAYRNRFLAPIPDAEQASEVEVLDPSAATPTSRQAD